MSYPQQMCKLADLRLSARKFLAETLDNNQKLFIGEDGIH